MKFYFHDLLFALSKALDSVEKELAGAQTNHSKRVACICAQMGTLSGLSDHELSDLTGYAILHDNALSEYLHTEYSNKGSINKLEEFALHCTFGEQNIRPFPFFSPVDDAILYHHENADGSGLFGKTADEVPDYARWIHIADFLDVAFDFSDMNEEKFDTIRCYVKKNRGKLFDTDDANLFLDAITYGNVQMLDQNTIDNSVSNSIPHFETNFEPDELIRLSSVFAKITDYKSIYTSNHSRDIAKRAYYLGKHYNFDEEKCAKLYLSGALHDIGKLYITMDILEKPGKLTDEEFAEIRNHAQYSYDVLREIEGFDDIVSWACHHHEKLDGSGYPFGLTGDQLGREERILACLDIYQALREERSYKKPKSHKDTIEILRNMKDTIDQEIVSDIETTFKDEVV